VQLCYTYGIVTLEHERISIILRRVKLTPRVCAMCAQQFAGWGRQRFCGKPCQRKWDYQQHADTRRANRRESYRQHKEERDGRGAEAP